MSGRWPRIVAGMAVLAVAVVLFVVLSPGGDGEGEDAAGQAATGQTEQVERDGDRQPADRSGPDGSSGATEDPAPDRSPGDGAEPKPEIPEIVVRDGRPAAGALELEVDRGERVVFDVRSDVAEEVHVHGYGVTRQIGHGGTTRIAFEADLEGVFEVELHGSGAPIAELTVHPG